MRRPTDDRVPRRRPLSLLVALYLVVAAVWAVLWAGRHTAVTIAGAIVFAVLFMLFVRHWRVRGR